MNLLQRLAFWVKTGADIQELPPVKSEAVIRYKQYFIHVLETDDGLNLTWSDDPGMMQSVPVREFWTAKAPKEES
jgi:hypothetical protein